MKVFVSYAWTSRAHRNWVEELVRRLRADGVDASLDVYEIKPGHDMYAFMERIVTDPDIEHVVIICDSGYASRADQRRGGVGAETQLITSELYGRALQSKFIPVVAERDARGDPYRPAYLRSRLFIDMSNPEHYEAGYRELLAALDGEPLRTAPPLGSRPNRTAQNASAPSTKRGSDSNTRRAPPIPKLSRKPTDLEREDFLQEGFDTIEHYFRDALRLTEETHPGVTGRLTRAESTIRAVIFQDGKKRATAVMRKGSPISSLGITWSSSESMGENSWNELLTVESDAEGLHFRAMGMPMHQPEASRLGPHEVAEYLWSLTVRNL